MQRRTQLYEGKAKVIFEGPEPGTVVAHFKDDSTDLTGGKPSVVTGKGVINNAISDLIMTRLSEIGVPTHLIKRLNMREQLLHKVEIIPIEVVVLVPFALHILDNNSGEAHVVRDSTGVRDTRRLFGV